MLANIFGSVCTIDLKIDTEEGRKFSFLRRDKKSDKCPVFSDGEDINGVAIISLKPGKKIEHYGIKLELIGQINMLNDKSNSYDFFAISKDLEPSGLLMESKQFKWKFSSVDKPHESYFGANVQLRYFIRLNIIKGYSGNIQKEIDFIVQNICIPPEINNTIKMEVGIEDCLHIEFEYDKSKYHLKDVVVGKVYFLLVRIKIKHMELDIIKMETTGVGKNYNTETETISKYEIMDGSPTKSECIPVRLYLNAFDLTPTYKNIQNKFSVKYYINLIIVDEDERRYFKKQEIFLWRKKLG
ncbi:vacuolar protein sorting-associated protein 26, putative [Hepatocystis sp. ex Piliocolobus tephrosceles]|uniref:Vacuolar protein sorting-associated protein 26 n=1 Tax=Piliocolobus tephrosceles TaxID=591936 RepID=A0A8C9LQ69_9PRIM|nr:vacuolar protein sorting-associated protein 26, putative [Hepatocystis sp. ex Piliocolobus tephrosceles]